MVGRPPHSAGATVAGGITKIDLSPPPSCPRHEGSPQKRNRPPRLLVSQTAQDDDDRTHPLNEQSPSHCPGSVSIPAGALHVPPHKPLGASVPEASNSKSTSASPAVSTPQDSTRPSRFRIMRRRSESTPDTAASTPPSLFHKSFPSSTSVATPPSQMRAPTATVKRGTRNQFSEIYSPMPQLPRRLHFQEQQHEQPQPPLEMATTNHPASVRGSSNGEQAKATISRMSSRGPPLEPSLPRTSKSLEPAGPAGGVQVHHKAEPNFRGGARTQPDLYGLNSKGSLSTTKTLIMNGDIVVCASHSNNTSDTATTASTASSKGRALRREAERISRAAASLDTKGNELFEKGYFDKAMACYSKALKLKRRTFAHLLEEVDDMEEELNLCDSKRADPQIMVSMATSINNIGYLRQRSGDATPEETMAAYKKSLQIKRRILGNDSLSVGKTLNNIGSVHYLKREFELAIPSYEEALKIMKVNLGDKHTDVATVMSNIGDVFLAQGDPETSLRQYRQALTIRWENFGEKDPRVVRLLEKIARVEIGDRMMTPKTRTSQAQQAWDDDEASEFLDSGLKTINEEFQGLHQQVAKDIEYVSLMERKATVEMLKDRIVIIRGMRDVWEGNGPELLDNDTASVKTARSLASRGGYD